MASLGVGKKHKVTVVGSGNWSVLAISVKEERVNMTQGLNNLETGRRKYCSAPGAVREGCTDVGI